MTDNYIKKILEDMCLKCEYLRGRSVAHERDERKENLIAAAPEMLNALKSIAEYWNRDCNEDAMKDACYHAIETALKAIAKAEGRVE